MAEKIKIGGELEAVTQDGKLADAAQVVDSTQNKTQELINSEVKEKLDAVINTDGSVKIPTITLSGDVTGSGTTAISGTIANSAVTTAKIANSAVTNAKLANSSVTIGNKSVSLGGTLTDIETSGTLTASTIKKSGGTSAQFLKADGSVDSNSYAATSAIPTKVSALTNDAGYLTTHQDISGKVDKVSGKGLSTNDYTDAEKEKVDGAFQTSNIITSSGQTPTTDKVFSSKVINDLVSSNYTTLNNAINQKADKTALPSAASATTAGLAKLYTSTGTNADGAMTQAAATTALGNKVDKESGKGLSTNDYTTAEKNKLSGIADNANNYTLPTASGSVLGGVKVGEGLSISNGVLNVSQDTDTRILYHAAQAPSSIATTYTGTYYVLADKNIAGNTTAAVIAYYSNGTAVNELTISAGEVRQCADGTRWQASGTGWTQIKSGVNVVQTTGTSTEDVMSQKAVTDELAKKVDLTSTQTISGTKAFTGASTFTGGTKNAVVNITSVNASRDYAHLFVSSNNSTLTTRPLILQKGYGNVAIGDSIAPSHKLEVAGTFQATGAATFSSSVTANSFVKSNGTSSQFLKADGSVDSSTYLTTHQDISGKVDKVDGKGLSTNDYTTDEKTKLANIEAAANRTVVDSAISSTSTNPVTSKAISTALASKADAVSGKSLSTNDYTTAEKTKLAGIAEGANKTTVDAALSATSTNPVTNKAVTEALAEKADVSSYVKLVLKGVAEAYYANASSIPSSAADGNYICDTGSSSTIKRCITIRAGGAVVNDVTATNGDFWLSKADGHVYAAVSNNTTSWVDCGKLQGEKGDKGDKGADGADGVDGADGTDGIDGAQTVVQTTGTSTTDVMSQIAVSQELLKQKYSFLYENADYYGANTASYMGAARTGAITSTKYPTLTEIVLDINLKAVYAEGVYSICGGRAGSALANLLLVKNGKLAYCNSSDLSTATETDYTFDDNYHHIISIWGTTYQKIYVDGELIVNTTVTTARSLYIGYNGIYFMSYMNNGGQINIAPADVHVKGPACLYINGELSVIFLGRWLSSMTARPYMWSSISGEKSFDKDNYNDAQYVLEKNCKETNLIAQNTLRIMPPHTFMSMENVVYTVTLTQEQADRINATPVISIKFCAKHTKTQPRYVGISVPKTNENKITVGDYTYYTGISIRRGYNQFGYIFQSSSSTQPSEGSSSDKTVYSVNTGKDYIACLWFTLNRITGEAFIYDESFNQIGYYQHESMKYEKFITSSNTLSLYTGEAGANLMEVAIYDGFIKTSGASGFLQQTVNFQTKDKWGDISNSLIYKDAYGTWNPNEDGYEHATFSANTRFVIEMGHYHDNTPQWMRKKIEILSGTINFYSSAGGFGSVTKWAFDADGNSVLDQTVGAGVYDIYMSGGKLSAYAVTAMSDGEMRVLESTVARSCELFRIENFAVLDGCMWEAAGQRLVEVTNTDHLIFNNLEAPSTGSLALYIGQKRSYNGNLYMVASDYTWKQINNS